MEEKPSKCNSKETLLHRVEISKIKIKKKKRKKINISSTSATSSSEKGDLIYNCILFSINFGRQSNYVQKIYQIVFTLVV